MPHALAGDDVVVTFDEQGAMIAATVATMGAAHGQPSCSHFLQCGGCKMQHMNAAAYGAWKQQFVQQALADNGLDPSVVGAPLISPPQSRRRATFAATKQGKQITLGFNQARSHQVIDLQMCSVLRPEITALLPPLRAMLASYMGEVRTLDLRVTLLDGVLDLVVIGGVGPRLREREMLGLLAQEANIGRISWRKWDRSADEVILQRLPVRAIFPQGQVDFPPGGFLQATQEGETALAQAVCAAVGAASPVADLFCGVGTFALALSPRALLAVDADGAAIAALQNALRNKARTTVTARNLVREPLTAMELASYKAVIFDPPRDGAKAQAQELAASKVPCVVAVSCDLNSFCRDAKILQAGGYQLESVTLVDQFLWSTHIELVGIFRK